MYLRIRKVRYRTATQVGCSPQARHKVSCPYVQQYVICELRKGGESHATVPPTAVPLISQRSPVSGLRQAIQGKGVILKRVETAGVYPLVRPRGVSADSARFASAPLPMSTIIKIDKYPQKGYTNLTRGYGGIGRRARFRFWCPRRAGSSPVTRTSKKNAVESLHSVFLLPIFTWTACSVPSAQSAPWLRWRAGACPHRSDLPHRMRQP